MGRTKTQCPGTTRFVIMALLGAAMFDQTSAIKIEHKATLDQQHKMHAQGIFSRMIDVAVAPEKAKEERHEATLRK